MFNSETRIKFDPSGYLAVTFSKDCLITSLSAAAGKQLQISARDLIGQPITHLLADRSAFDLLSMLDTALQRGLWDGTVSLCSSDGKHLESQAFLMPLSGCDNVHCGYLLFSIPAPPAAGNGEESLHAEVAAKLRKIAHELNNPLAVMMGFAQLILLQTNCKGQIQCDMEKLYSELERVIQVVEELHAYAIALQGRDTSVRP